DHPPPAEDQQPAGKGEGDERQVKDDHGVGEDAIEHGPEPPSRAAAGGILAVTNNRERFNPVQIKHAGMKERAERPSRPGAAVEVEAVAVARIQAGAEDGPAVDGGAVGRWIEDESLALPHRARKDNVVVIDVVYVEGSIARRRVRKPGRIALVNVRGRPGDLVEPPGATVGTTVAP